MNADFNIADYLKKFQKFLPFESRVKNAVISAVSDILKITIARTTIKVSGKNVFISGSSALKSEISIKQQKILNRIKELEPVLIIERIQ